MNRQAELQAELEASQKLDHLECAADPCEFIERHVTIEDPQGAVLRFLLWPYQRTSVMKLHEDGQVVVLKARRLGLSWLFLAYALWLAIFNQGVRVLVLCKNEGDAAELLDRIRRMRDRMAADPASVHLLAGLPRPKKVRDAVTTLDIGESTIKALVGTPAAARSETAGLVLLDEFAFQKRAGKIWRALIPTIDGGGKVGVISTGDGITGDAAEFANQWSRAVSGESGFTHLFWPWDVRPDRDEEWKQRQIGLVGGEDRFSVEYPEKPDDAFQSPDVIQAFSHAGIDAAEALGAKLDENGAPDTEGVALGIDWGDHTTSAVVVHPLEAGGVYVTTELEEHGTEPAAATAKMLEAAANSDFPLTEARYDAAGAQSMRTFIANSPESIGIWTVAFSKHKKATYGYIKQLVKRTAEGKDIRVIAISPKCAVLLRQMRSYEIDPKTGMPKKGDDHTVDALIAGMAPIAEAHLAMVEEASS